MRNILMLAVLLAVSLTASAQTTTWKELLGPAEPASIEQRTPLGIRYIAHGFDTPKQKRIAKTIRWMQKRGVPNALIEEYRQFALKLTESHAVIPQMIDAAFSQTRSVYIGCDGKWKSAALQIKPSDILVSVEAAPVWSEHWKTYAAGLAWGSKNLIQAVNVSANGIMSEPKSAGPLRKFSDLMFWEMGNYFSFKAGHRINTPADELGSSSPCAARPRGLSEPTVRL